VQYNHCVSFVGASGVLFGVIAQIEGAAGSTVRESTTNSPFSTLPNRTTFVEHGNPTLTTTPNASPSPVVAAHVSAYARASSPRIPHPIADSVSSAPTDLDLEAIAPILFSAPAPAAVDISTTRVSVSTAPSGASKNAARPFSKEPTARAYAAAAAASANTARINFSDATTASSRARVIASHASTARVAAIATTARGTTGTDPSFDSDHRDASSVVPSRRLERKSTPEMDRVLVLGRRRAPTRLLARRAVARIVPAFPHPDPRSVFRMYSRHVR